MFIRNFETVSIVNAQTLYHYTERYRYMTEITTYLLRGYMVVDRTEHLYTGTVYATPEQAQEGLEALQTLLRGEGKNRLADALVVAPHDFTETVCKKRAHRLQ